MAAEYRGSSFDQDYWLSRCERFRVESPEGRIGVVHEVRYGTRADRPDALVVRAGILGRRRLIVAVDQVERIITRKKLVVLRPSPRIERSERGD
jgi:hypothetical protein